MKIFFIRHGETQWNKLKKFQGHTDTPLCESGIQQVSKWTLPQRIEHWFVSPLYRARQTAELHQLQPITISKEIIEAFWGDWEGKNLKQLRIADAEGVARIESSGLDMRPPGGESPREVRTRLVCWLMSIDQNFKRIGVITHRGVIRAALSQATGWDMHEPHRVNITHNNAYAFNWENQTLEYSQEYDLLVKA